MRSCRNIGIPWVTGILSALFLSFIFPGVLTATPPAGYVQVWSDEFDSSVGSAPSSSNWGYDTGAGGWGNGEFENYTTSLNNSKIVADPNAGDGSALAIIAIDTTPGNGTYNTMGRYTSARITTSGKRSFQYGWMEARIQVPTGKGIWPAYWMLGQNITSGVSWPTCGETDIMEQVGNAGYTTRNYGSLHDGLDWSVQYFLPSGQFNTAYHTFAAWWQQDQIQFYVDDTLYETVNASQQTSGTWEFNHPFFFILNQAVGGSFPGTPDGSTSFPQTMLVDYVRVYQQATPTPTASYTPTETFTPTDTPTPCIICPPTDTPTPGPQPGDPAMIYPNPSRGGPVKIHIPGREDISDIKVQIFSVGYRKVFEQVFPQMAPGQDVVLAPTDNWDDLLANGLYYVVVTSDKGQTILKWLILR